MAIKGVSITVSYKAFDTGANAYKTGDSANHSLRVMKDGTDAASANSPSEISSANRPGDYKLVLTAGEMGANVISLGGKSSTSGIILIFAGDIVTEQGLIGTPASGSLSGDLAEIEGETDGIAAIPTTPFLAASAPANFSSLLISGSGHISNVDTLTTYTGNTPQTGDSFIRLGAPAGASIAADLAEIEAETDGIAAIPTADVFGRLGAPVHASISADIAAITTGGLSLTQIADAVLGRDLATSVVTVGEFPRRSLGSAVRKTVNRIDTTTNAGQLTVMKEDDATTAYIQPVITNALSQPIISVG